MVKLGIFLILLFVPCFTFSQSDVVQDFDTLDIGKVMTDIDTIKSEMDSTFYYIKNTYEILKEEVKLFGLKKTIQINFGIFKPIIFFFIGFYVLWLIKKKTINQNN